MTATFTDAQREALREFCDTIVPSIERADDPTGFWARKAIGPRRGRRRSRS